MMIAISDSDGETKSRNVFSDTSSHSRTSTFNGFACNPPSIVTCMLIFQHRNPLVDGSKASLRCSTGLSGIGFPINPHPKWHPSPLGSAVSRRSSHFRFFLSLPDPMATTVFRS